MKQLTSYNRVAGYLNKIFDLLNAEYFESSLSSIVSHKIQKINKETKTIYPF